MIWSYSDYGNRFRNVRSFMTFALFVQIVMIVLYAATTTYASPGDVALYPHFQDVHVMMFIGFGFLMTFLRKYGFSALTYNMMIAAFSIQWGAWLTHFLVGDAHLPVKLDLAFLTDGDIAAAAVLISFGAILGRATPFQLLFMAFYELIFYCINFWISTKALNVKDVGGSIVVHTFGAYFGLAVSFMLGVPINEDENKSKPDSDIFSMVGTLFLWIYWPSFNGYYAGPMMSVAFINTVLSLTASVLASIVASLYLSDEMLPVIDMVHIQNSTLAGGVAAGAAADMNMTPAGALATGLIAGFISVYGYSRFSPYMAEKGLVDTCGVNNLHGMPGIMGGLVSCIVLIANGQSGQSGNQLVALSCTLGFAVVSGLICGWLMKRVQQVTKPFQDPEFFLVPSDYSTVRYSTTVRRSTIGARRSSAAQRPVGGPKPDLTVQMETIRAKEEAKADL